MSYWLALILAAGVVFAVSAVTLLGIAAISAPRNITRGPAVILARVLFVVAVLMLAVIVVAFIIGVATSWA